MIGRFCRAVHFKRGKIGHTWICIQKRKNGVLMDTLKVQIKRGFLGSLVRGIGEQRRGFKGVIHKRVKGDISSFSAASCARLRKSLCVFRPSWDVRLCGLTLTIPGDILQPSYLRLIWHLFRVRASQKFSDLPWVWRIELQKRKQAHFHLVVYGRSFKDAFGLRELWEDVIQRKLSRYLDKKTMSAFLRHGVKIDDLSGCDSSGVIGYLCDHTSKHKQEQIGWIGRQWGIVNRHAFKVDTQTVFECSPRDWILIRRQYIRLQKSLKKQGRYYGRRLAVSRRGDVFGGCLFGLDERRIFDIIRRMKGCSYE